MNDILDDHSPISPLTIEADRFVPPVLPLLPKGHFFTYNLHLHLMLVLLLLPLPGNDRARSANSMFALAVATLPTAGLLATTFKMLAKLLPSISTRVLAWHSMSSVSTMQRRAD